MADLRSGPILVVGEHVGDRWDIAWALHEAGMSAEQVGSAEQARARLSHGRVMGVVVEAALGDDVADGLAAALDPDPATGEIPFLLVASRATTPAAVVARVQTLLQAAASDELKL